MFSYASDSSDKKGLRGRGRRTTSWGVSICLNLDITYFRWHLVIN
jgi:hypothetical protein